MNYYVTFFTENLRGITTETALECFSKQFERKEDAITYFENWCEDLKKMLSKEISSLSSSNISAVIVDVRNEDDSFCEQEVIDILKKEEEEQEK